MGCSAKVPTGQIGKVGVELKISNGQKVFFHKSDVENIT